MRSSTADFEGAYKDVAEGINQMVGGHIIVKKKAMACIAEFGKGNFEAPLEKFPGKKAFINDTIEQVRSHLKAAHYRCQPAGRGGSRGQTRPPAPMPANMAATSARS